MFCVSQNALIVYSGVRCVRTDVAVVHSLVPDKVLLPLLYLLLCFKCFQ